MGLSGSHEIARIKIPIRIVSPTIKPPVLSSSDTEIILPKPQSSACGENVWLVSTGDPIEVNHFDGRHDQEGEKCRSKQVIDEGA